MGDVRLRRHPTHHPLGACLAAAVAVRATTVGAAPLEAAVWSDAARRCVSAMETGTPLDTEGFTAPSDPVETDNGWPKLEIFAGPAGVGFKQETRETGTTAPIRNCTVAQTRPFAADQLKLMIETTSVRAEQLLESGRFVEKKTRRKVDYGMVSVLTSTRPNARGCHMTIEFVIDLDRLMATAETKERLGADCGGGS